MLKVFYCILYTRFIIFKTNFILFKTVEFFGQMRLPFNVVSGLLNKNEKLLNTFWFKDLNTQKDLSVIKLHTQLNQNYNELQMKKSLVKI